MERREPSCTIGGNKTVPGTLENSMAILAPGGKGPSATQHMAVKEPPRGRAFRSGTAQRRPGGHWNSLKAEPKGQLRKCSQRKSAVQTPSFY